MYRARTFALYFQYYLGCKNNTIFTVHTYDPHVIMLSDINAELFIGYRNSLFKCPILTH